MKVKHEVTVNVSRPKREKVLVCKVIPADSKHLEKLINETDKLTIIIPGDSVKGISIKEIGDNGEENSNARYK